MTLLHPLFAQPFETGIGVWRYMNLAKLLRMLQTQTLYFARSDHLGDPFEGSNTTGMALRLKAACQPGREEDLRKLYPHLPLDQARYAVEAMRNTRRESRARTFISCWHMGNVESAAMWSLYGGEGASVAIRCTYDNLRSALPAATFFGAVNYLDWNSEAFDQGNTLAPFICKRSSYRHENEIRAVIERDVWSVQNETRDINFDEFGAAVSMDIARIATQIYVSPAAPLWFENVVRDSCIQYGLHSPVKRSDLESDPLY